MSNYIRQAANSRGTLETKSTSPSDGSMVRERIFREGLSQQEREDDEIQAEQKEYQIILCKLQPHHSGKVLKGVVETSSPAPAVAESICPLGLMHNRAFALPFRALPHGRSEEWEKSFPKFENWLISRFRFPELSQDETTLVASNSMRKVHQVDLALCYATVYTNTAQQFFQEGEARQAAMLHRVMRGMCHFLAKESWTVNASRHAGLCDLLPQLLRERMADRAQAIKFDQLGDTYTVAEYIAALFQTAVTHPGLVTRSTLHQLPTLVPLLHLVPGDVLSLEGIQHSLLRMAIERSFRHVNLPSSLQNVLEVEEAIQVLVGCFSRSMFFSLRYWAYWITFNREIGPGMTEKQFVARAQAVRTFVHRLPEGILPLCYAIDPDSQRYLTEASLAELCLARSQFTSRSALGGEILLEHTDPVEVRKLVQANRDRILEEQRKLEELERQQVEGQELTPGEGEVGRETLTVEQLSKMSKEEILLYWSPDPHRVLSQRPPPGYEGQLQVLFLAGKGDQVERALDLLAYYSDTSFVPRGTTLHLRRMIHFLIRISPPASRLWIILPKLYWSTDAKQSALRFDTILRRDYFLSKGHRKIADYIRLARHSRKLHQDEDGKDSGSLPARDRVLPEERLPAPLANLSPEDLEQVSLPHLGPEEAQLIFKELQTTQLPQLLTAECYVCMESFAPNQLVPLHAPPGHELCAGCKSKLTLCPLCRAPITQ